MDGKNIYSFLTGDISAAANCIFDFNLFNREINIVLAKNIGKDSGVIIDKYHLLNSLEVTCNSDNIYTRYNVSGGGRIDIKYVNFGSTRITDLSYFINARNESGRRIYVSDTLAAKYKQYISDRELARERYMTLTRQYNQALADIDDLKYKVPNDSVHNDWDSFTDAELDASYKTYHQLLATLQSLYKEDYGSVGCNSDGSINENYIRSTEYWQDYYAYQATIEQITAAIHARADGSRYADIDNESILKKINAYKTEWSLYGVVELENKITAYNNSMQVLIDGEAIILKHQSQEAKAWDDLSEDEKTKYGGLKDNYKYSAYMDLYHEKTSCQLYLNQLNAKLKDAEKIRDAARENRTKLAALVEIESYNRTELKKIVPLPSSSITDPFTEAEIRTINLLCIDKNYSNENILTTSLDTTVSEIEKQYELLEDAKEQLSIESQPQISFHATIENLLVMPEFKDFDFEIGNFVSLEYYDDYYVDLRLVSMTFNPCIPENSLDVSFSTFIKSKSERTDMSNILGLAVGSSSGSSGSSGGSGTAGNFGTGDDIDVTISNTMLSKLLNTEMFGTRVSNIILDTIKVNEITAKYAKFEGLAKGSTIIDGKCITTGYITDKSYNGTNGDITNTKGSVINLETGEFSFAGGALKYAKNSYGDVLSIKGTICADSGYIGGQSGFTITAGKLYSNGHSSYNTAKEGVYIGTDYISLGNGGVTYFNKYGTGKIGAWHVNADAIYRENSSLGANGGMYFGIGGLSISDVFKVDSAGNTSITDRFTVTSDGAMTATNATITGDITATKLTATQEGSIAGWKLNSDAIYRNNSAFGDVYSMYFGKEGLSITDKFKVDSNGNFNFGNGKLIFDGEQLTFGSDVTLNWEQVVDADANVTQITQDTITTEYLNAKDITAGSVAAENITGTTISGKTLSGGSISIGNDFSVDSSGKMACAGATIQGNIYATKLVTENKYYVHDSLNNCNVAVINCHEDDKVSNSVLDLVNFGYLGSSDGYKSYNYISFYQQLNGEDWVRTCELHSPSFIVNGTIHSGSVIPRGNNADGKAIYQLGNATYKWRNIYATNGTIQTSNRNQKHDIKEISSVYEKLFFGLKPVSYMFNNGDRVHLGIIAQDLKETMTKLGLSNMDLAAFCCDAKTKTVTDEKTGRQMEVPDLDKDGNTQYDFGVRYSEFIMLIAHMLQKAYKIIDKQQDEIDWLKTKIMKTI